MWTADQAADTEELTGCGVRRAGQSAVFYMAMLFFRDVKDGPEG